MATIYTNTDQTKASGNVYSLATYDTLMIGAEAQLAAIGTNADAINAALADWITLMLAGDLFAARDGIVAREGADIRISSTGSIMADDDGILLTGHGNEVTNAGEIIATSSGIETTGEGRVSLVNSGVISGRDGVSAAQASAVYNTGLIEGRGFSDGGAGGGSGDGVLLKAGGLVVNDGTIIGSGAAIRAYSGQFVAGTQVFNTGTLNGNSTAIMLQAGNDKVFNEGLITGKVHLESGNDLFDGSTGRQREQIDGGAGADTILGGVNGERLAGGDDADIIEGAAGNDTVDGGAGADLLDGGEGRDLLSYLGSSAAVLIDLSTGEAEGGHAAGDEFSGFEALMGSHHADTLLGSATHDHLNGASGNDSLGGASGDDTIHGGLGNDTFLGGAGRDVLTGGAGADSFRYTSASHSSTSIAGRDRINDFNGAEGDKIDLSSIDASTPVAGNGAFAFIGSAAFTGAGQLRAVTSGVSTMVYGEVDGDGTADFAIQLRGVIALAEGDFVL